MNPVCPKSGNRVRPATANSRLLHFGEKSHEASVLDRDGELALILGAGAGDGTRGDLAIGSDELAKELSIFVIDIFDVVLGEIADLAAGTHFPECHV